jgi:hypothetical protein
MGEAVQSKTSGKNVEIKFKGVRLSFTDVFEPIQGTDDKGNPTDRFYVSTSILLDKATPEGKAQIAAVREAMKIARAAEWGENPPSIPANCLCLQDGEPIDPTTQDMDENEQPIPGTGTRVARWDGYQGMMYVSANRVVKAKTLDEAKAIVASKNPVQILGPRKTGKDSQGNPVFPSLCDADGLIYSGCYADVIIQVWPYNAAGKPGQSSRISASLEAIKFVRHGEAFGMKKIDAQSAFDEEDGDEDDALGGAAAGDAMDDLG